jgi:L-alanine-DL-glutamate epimerase-like enolase superfamily enzyme
MVTSIAEVRLHRRAVPLVRPFVTAVRTATAIDVMLVEVVDTDGRSGWGEAPTSWRVTGESPASVRAAVEGPLRDAVLGMPLDPFAALDSAATASVALERAVVRNSAARMAVDCALYDVAAQAVGIPLHKMLAPGALDLVGAPDASASKVRTDMTLSAIADAADIPQLVTTAVEHTDAGFRTIKVKVGKADAAGGLDVAALRAVRDAVGPAVTLRADANQGWTPEQAVDVIRAWEDAGLGIELVEQPVNRDDLDGLAFVTERVNTSVLADESVWTVRDAREVIARRAADLVNIKLAKTGGIREALSLLRVANDAGVSAIVGCMMESHVGIAAAAAVAAAVDAASGAPTAHDLDAGLWLSASPVLGGVRYDGQTVTMPDRPGLGILGLRADDPVHRNGSAGSAE